MWGNLGTISQYAAQQYTITVEQNYIKLLRRRRNFSRLQRIGDVRRRRSLNRLLNWSKLTPFGPFQVKKRRWLSLVILKSYDFEGPEDERYCPKH